MTPSTGSDEASRRAGPPGGWSSRSHGRRPVLAAMILACAVIAAAIHLGQTATYALSAGQYKNLHVGLALIVVFLSLAERSPTRLRASLLLVLAAASLLPLAYIHVEYDALVTLRIFESSPWDNRVSLLLVGTTLLAVALKWGITIPLIAVLAMLYAYFGAAMPGDLLFHTGIEMDRLLSYAAIPYFQGILGSLTSLSASVVFIFMLFAGVLKSAGGIELLLSAARAIGSRSRAAPAHVAILSSGFLGMISGSTVANVASTGSMTIPMMKRFGFRAEHAAAIEAVASTGGQFAPPVMGLTAFLIVGMTGIPYNQVMLAAVFSAVIYYACLMAAVSAQHDKDRWGGRAAAAAGDDAPPVEFPALLREYGHLLIGIGVLVALLVRQMPPAFAAAWSIVVIAVTESVKQLVRSRGRPAHGLAAAARVLIRGIDDGVRSGAELAIVIAAIGIFVDVLVTTGLAQKLSFLLFEIASDRLWLLLGMTAVACLLFGLGMPTPAAYILVALLGAPALERAGVPQLAAHMFVFFFANMSAITPPVAVAALVAARLGDAGYFRTAFAACRYGLAGFVLPFVFVYAPAILLIDSHPGRQWLTFAATLLALVAANTAIVGFFRHPLAPWQRLFAAAAAALLLRFEPAAAAAALVLLGVAATAQFRTGIERR